MKVLVTLKRGSEVLFSTRRYAARRLSQEKNRRGEKKITVNYSSYAWQSSSQCLLHCLEQSELVDGNDGDNR